jgi:glycosyltransferase involved in cell wall biosynthesis
MKVLSLSLDQHILDKESVVAVRNARYGEALELYTIIVPSDSSAIVALSPTTTVYGTGGKTRAVQFFNMLRLASSMMKKGGHDVITSQDTYYLGLIGFFLSRVYKAGHEVQVLGIEKLTPLRKLISKFTLSHAHSIRVLSLRLKKRLITEFGIKEDNMNLVPIYVEVSSLGFNASASFEEEQELKRHQAEFNENYGNRFNIVSVNRLVPIKNIPMQIEAVARLKDEFPQVLLHVLGDGPLKEELQKMIEERQISAHVILQGPRFKTDLGSFLTESDCFVLTSNFEGYGMVIVEAATAGAPIVMTDVGCAGEVVKDQESALVVPINDVDAYTEALRRMLTDESLRRRLKEKASQSVAELPTFDMVLQKYMGSWQHAALHKN